MTENHNQQARVPLPDLTPFPRENSNRGAKDGWRPIETAPKDGTRILAWPCDISRDRVGAAFVCWGAEGWELNPGPSAVHGIDWWQDPTHWQPLPEGPTA